MPVRVGVSYHVGAVSGLGRQHQSRAWVLLMSRFSKVSEGMVPGRAADLTTGPGHSVASALTKKDELQSDSPTG